MVNQVFGQKRLSIASRKAYTYYNLSVLEPEWYIYMKDKSQVYMLILITYLEVSANCYLT